MADDDLSDHQIQHLLKDAEQRIRSSKQKLELSNQSPSISYLQKSITQGNSTTSMTSYIKIAHNGAHVDSSCLVKPEERKLSNTIRQVEDPITVKKNTVKKKKATAGTDWYNLPRTNLTPEFKRDLQLLRLRSVLDPKRHYKKEPPKTQVPEYSQVGTIIEGPTEYFSARLSKKDRKRTFVEEVLSGESFNHRFLSKYNEIQAAKSSGKKDHYKKMKALRRKSGSTG